MSKLGQRQACKINWGGGQGRETLLPGKMGEMRGHACDQDGEETRKEMHATEVRGREAGLRAPRLSSLPRPGGSIRTLVHRSHRKTPWHRKFPLPSLPE